MDTKLPRARYHDQNSLNIMNTVLCSNKNRVAILHLLKNTPDNEMQAERIAGRLGLTHRAVLYHLDVLEQDELVEVRAYRKKGDKLFRSVWGLNSKDQSLLNKFFKKINGNFDKTELNRMIKRNTPRR